MSIRSSLIYTSSILLCIIPFVLLSGPFLPDLFVSIIGLIFLYLSMSERRWYYYNNKYVYFFLFFYIYLILRSLTSEYIIFSLESSLFYFRFGVFALAVWFLIDNQKKLIKYFTFALSITFIFTLLSGYFQFLTGSNFFGYDSFYTRLSLPFNDKLILGGYLVRLLPLLIGLILYNNFSLKFTYSFLFIIIIFTDVLIYLSGERTAIALFLISTILIILSLSKFKKLRILTLFITLIIVFSITITNENIMDRNIHQTINQMNLNSDTKNYLLFSKSHQSKYETALNIAKDRPIFGVGPNLFRIYCESTKYKVNDQSCSTHPHNTILQLIAELGIVGLIIILVAYYFIFTSLYFQTRNVLFKQKIKKKLKNDFEICLIVCFFINLFPFLPTQNFFNNWISIIYYLPIGFYLYLNNYKKNNYHYEKNDSCL